MNERRIGPKERTRVLLDRFKKQNNEWTRLHGILCMAHGWDTESASLLHKVIDMHMIAKRMDEINAKWGTPLTNSVKIER